MAKITAVLKRIREPAQVVEVEPEIFDEDTAKVPIVDGNGQRYSIWYNTEIEAEVGTLHFHMFEPICGDVIMACEDENGQPISLPQNKLGVVREWLNSKAASTLKAITRDMQFADSLVGKVQRETVQ